MNVNWSEKCTNSIASGNQNELFFSNEKKAKLENLIKMEVKLQRKCVFFGHGMVPYVSGA